MRFVSNFPLRLLSSSASSMKVSSLKSMMPLQSRNALYPITLTTVKQFSIKNHRQLCTSDKGKPEDHVAELVKSSRIVLFMKGNPNEPRCGFSNAVCRILEMHGILEKARKGDDPKLFSSYDVLESEDLRTGAKVFADWPTFPQVYFDGEFIGGCDIVLDMHRSGKLTEELERLGIGSALKKASEEGKS
ncbi:unnamed protein product [Heterobilharzia americana]|nr:unnamed protein product [Heterobilharzia americana]